MLTRPEIALHDRRPQIPHGLADHRDRLHTKIHHTLIASRRRQLPLAKNPTRSHIV
jgi:hypothetical protein